MASSKKARKKASKKTTPKKTASKKTVPKKPEKPVAAEVIMKTRGAPDPAALTAATVQNYMPDAETVKRAEEWFAKKGFKIEAAGPMSFSISGPAEAFREVLKMKGQSLTKPKELDDDVEEVSFTPPPDFGPTSY